MSNQVIEALEKLDPSNDGHWTSDGAPRVDVVQELSGVKDIKRADIVALAPELTRESARASLAPPPSPVEKDDTVDVSPLGEVTVDEQTAAARRAKMAEQHAALEQQIEAARKDINERVKTLNKLIKAQDELSQELEQTHRGHMQNQKNIMEFLDGQHQQRIARHEGRRQILKGINPNELDPRSKLDQAFARKNARGSTRPGVAASRT